MHPLQKYIIVILISLIAQQQCWSQSIGYAMPNNMDRVEIPFSFHNGFIVLPVLLRGFFPVKFIFDTGAENTIITNPRLAQQLDLRYTRKYEIMGSDMDTVLNAFLIKDVRLGLSEGAAPTQDVLTFDRDYFNLEEYIGDNVLGILGGDVFKNYTVMIDYQNAALVIYRKGAFKPSRKYTKIAMEVIKNKPYIQADLVINDQQGTSTRLLIDTGASLALLLDADKEKGLNLPDKTIKGILGYGIGGELEGYLGRITSFDIEGIHFDNLITNFRIYSDRAYASQLSVYDQKDGLIGNEILKHFRCVLDYKKELFYLQPYKKNYNKKVTHDRSGLGLIMVGKHLQQIMVSNVFDGSPAAEAGFVKGDLIKSINLIPMRLITYDGIIRKFKSSKNKKYRIKINRQGKILTLEFKLRDLI